MYMKKNFFFAGIQQVGIGVEHFEQAWKWYIDMFQMDIKILEDDTVAAQMLPYTGNVPQKRHACIAINLQGGGGFEIWQYSERKPQPIAFDIQVGDLGVFVAKLKCTDVVTFHQQLAAKYDKVGPIGTTPDGQLTFFVEDPFGNYFQAVHEDFVCVKTDYPSGGVAGMMVGVTDVEKALTVYQDILGFDEIVYDQTGKFNDLAFLRGGDQQYRRVLLRHSQPRKGSFSGLYGPGYIELVTALERQPRKIFEGRYWGDPGFIQICMDVINMKELEAYCQEKGYPFTVDSCANQKQFDMGEASGHFTYIEDPDGTLIEFVETYRIPLARKLHIYIDLMKRDREKSLPKFFYRLMRFNRVKK
jgi:catechol 2,3-dioxygenase-like lactoylglutathione lyase family enzyme